MFCSACTGPTLRHRLPTGTLVSSLPTPPPLAAVPNNSNSSSWTNSKSSRKHPARVCQTSSAKVSLPTGNSFPSPASRNRYCLCCQLTFSWEVFRLLLRGCLNLQCMFGSPIAVFLLENVLWNLNLWQFCWCFISVAKPDWTVSTSFRLRVTVSNHLHNLFIAKFVG